jgi:hypothetical protein
MCQFNKGELEQKLSKFKKLKTVENKISFWDQELGINYLSYLERADQLLELYAFQIGGTDKENLELSNWIFKNFPSLKSSNNNSILLNIKNLKKLLTQTLKCTKNKEYFLKKEIIKIENSFKLYAAPPEFNGIAFKINSIYNADYETYENIIKYNLEPNYSANIPDINIISVRNGLILARYLQYLQEQIRKLKHKNDSKIKLTVPEIALFLHYTGVSKALSDHSYSNVDISKIFSSLLDIHDKRLCDYIKIPRMKRSLRKDNFEKVLEFMESKKLEKFTKCLKQDLVNFISKNYKSTP